MRALSSLRGVPEYANRFKGLSTAAADLVFHHGRWYLHIVTEQMWPANSTFGANRSDFQKLLPKAFLPDSPQCPISCTPRPESDNRFQLLGWVSLPWVRNPRGSISKAFSHIKYSSWGNFSVMRFFGLRLLVVGTPAPSFSEFLRLNLKEWIKTSRYLADLFIEPHDPITPGRHAFVMFVTSRIEKCSLFLTHSDVKSFGLKFA